MSNLLDYNFDEIPDQVLLPEGEASLRITKVEEKMSAKGAPMVVVCFESLDEPNASLIYEYLTLPVEGDEERIANNKLRRVRNLAIAFGVPSMETSTWVGCTGWAAVRVEAGTDGFEDKNRIAKYLGAGK